MIRFAQKGMTLIELTVVLLILIALAGLAIPYIGGTSRKALCDTTDVSMANIKRAIMERYYLDTLGHFPQDLKGLTSAGTPKYNLHYLFSNSNLLTGANDRTHKDFDPDSATGWRSGGYLQNGLVLENDLTGNFSNTTYTDPLKQNHITVIDAWGRPIVIQVPTIAQCDSITGLSGTATAYCARLVSAGPGSGFGVENADIETSIVGNRSNDDRVLYLTAATPAADINLGCDQ